VKATESPGTADALPDPHMLHGMMQDHLQNVRIAARDNEFVDTAEAIRLHMLLAEALESWDDLDAGQRAVLAGAVDYLVLTNDEEDDLLSPIGFEDDVEVVEAALEQIRWSGRG
jgi:uncharacterized membrane protein YkvA (DUF1232 family)